MAGVATSAAFTLTQNLPPAGTSVIGTTLYIAGQYLPAPATTSGSASVSPAGTSNNGSHRE